MMMLMWRREFVSVWRCSELNSELREYVRMWGADTSWSRTTDDAFTAFSNTQSVPQSTRWLAHTDCDYRCTAYTQLVPNDPSHSPNPFASGSSFLLFPPTHSVNLLFRQTDILLKMRYFFTNEWRPGAQKKRRKCGCLWILKSGRKLLLLELTFSLSNRSNFIRVSLANKNSSSGCFTCSLITDFAAYLLFILGGESRWSWVTIPDVDSGSGCVFDAIL